MSEDLDCGVSYDRISQARQAGGDGIARQDRGFQRFCEKHGLRPLPDTFVDEGRSGWTGAHRTKGKLGQLIAMAQDRAFPPRTVIVVEAWDRLGRMRPDRQIDLLRELLATGVAIGIVSLDLIFRESDFGTHKWSTLSLFVQLAFHESQQKSERLQAQHEARRAEARATGRLLPGRLPGWLVKIDGKAHLPLERGDTMKRIFALSADGFSARQIIAALDREGHKAFAAPLPADRRRIGRASGAWNPTYINQLLGDRRAVGEVQPRDKDGNPAGPPLSLFYPQAVTDEEWRAAQAGRPTWRGDRAAGRDRKHVNAFRGLLREAGTGSGYNVRGQDVAGKSRMLLVNTDARTTGVGRMNTFPYLLFEEGLLRLLAEVKAADVLRSPDADETRMKQLTDAAAAANTLIASLKDDLRRGYSRALSDLVRATEDELAALEGQIREEALRAARPAAAVWGKLPDLVTALRTADDPNPLRVRIRTLLARVLTETLILICRQRSWAACAVSVWFVGGARRDFVLVYRPPVGRREHFFDAASVRWEDGGVPLDMRDAADLKRLDALLRSLAPAALLPAR
jgi:DNA invertase Pin-like site-specific DNA recombinase